METASKAKIYLIFQKNGNYLLQEELDGFSEKFHDIFSMIR